LSPSRVPAFDDIAQTLATRYTVTLSSAPPIAIVTHSQGGLVLQRFLAWMLQQGRGQDLARICTVIMLACPNNGSDYLRTLRHVLGYRRHPQAGSLEMLNRQVADAQRMVLSGIVNARAVGERECPIPFHVYAGDSDRVVVAASAQAAFPGASTVPGNHFSILDPEAPGNCTAETVAHHLLNDLASWPTPRASDHSGASTDGAPPAAPRIVEGPMAQSGNVTLNGLYVAGHDMTFGGGEGHP
jgi:hypothetical protein